MTLPDVQAMKPEVEVPVFAGVDRVYIPVKVKVKDGKPRSTHACFHVNVLIGSFKRGADMSRISAAIHELADTEINLDVLSEAARKIGRLCESERVNLHARCLYFFPVTSDSGYHGYIHAPVIFYVAHYPSKSLVGSELEIPVATVCPCSAELCGDGSAHNQRAVVYVTVVPQDGKWIWFEEVKDIVDFNASSKVYPVLKRTDEKEVTRQMFSNARFVEDVARGIYRDITKSLKDKVRAFWVCVKSLESIHAHNAVATVAYEGQTVLQLRAAL